MPAAAGKIPGLPAKSGGKAGNDLAGSEINIYFMDNKIQSQFLNRLKIAVAAALITAEL
ncbi:MAG: hypothetical protein ACOX8W_09510 [bacterium]